MIRFVRDCFLLTAALALSAGCEPSGGGGGFEASPDNGDRHALTEVGEILRNRMLNTTQPPRGQADIARYEMQAFNHYLEPQGAPTEVASNKERILDISAVVQRGGILVLTPIDSGRPNRGSPDN